MTHRSYAAALEKVLKPVGFERKGMNFRRTKDDFEDHVMLQTNPFAGITVNIYSMDLVSLAILNKVVPKYNGPMPFQGRIGAFIDGADRWWRRDPNGPKQMAEEVETYILPFLQQIRPLEEQARRLGRGAGGWGTGQFWLAVTLYRMGEVAEARQQLGSPPPRLWREHHLPEIEAMRRWLACETGPKP